MDWSTVIIVTETQTKNVACSVIYVKWRMAKVRGSSQLRWIVWKKISRNQYDACPRSRRVRAVTNTCTEKVVTLKKTFQIASSTSRARNWSQWRLCVLATETSMLASCKLEAKSKLFSFASILRCITLTSQEFNVRALTQLTCDVTSQHKQKQQ